MDIRFQAGGPEQWRAQAVIAFGFEGEPFIDGVVDLVAAAPWLTIAPAVRDFMGKKNELTVFYGHPDLAVPRVIAVGLGKREAFSLQTLRLAAATGMQRAYALKLDTVAMCVPQLDRLATEVLHANVALQGADFAAADVIRLTEEAVCAALLGLYRYTDMKSKPVDGEADSEGKAPRWFALLFNGDSVDEQIHAAARRGEAQAAGVCYTRDLVNGPANTVTPVYLAEEAQKLAKRYAFAVEILTAAQAIEMGMGCFASVFNGSAAGTEHEARFIILEHAPEGTENDAPLVFVGKGVTFDTGGISLKPGAKMHEMKSDMAGAGAVFGLFKALGESDISRRVIGIMPCTENMPDANATRPGDVVTSLSGKTVEILNTDAEGRLILCDALTYAQNRWQDATIVDLATLTGACIVALGLDAAAIFCDDKALSEAIIDAGHACGDIFWPMPLWESSGAKLKNSVADIANIGTREGGSIQAAMFLKFFIKKGVRWAHLDIAGPAYRGDHSALCRQGATGFAVRTLYGLVRQGV